MTMLNIAGEHHHERIENECSFDPWIGGLLIVDCGKESRDRGMSRRHAWFVFLISIVRPEVAVTGSFGSRTGISKYMHFEYIR